MWTRIKNLSTLVTKGTTPRGGNVAYSASGIGFLRAENVKGFDKLNYENLKYISKETHFGFLSRSILKENDVLITIAGTLGRTAIVRKDDLPLNTNQAVSIIRLVNDKIVNLLYLIAVLNAPLIFNNLTNQKKITAIPNLTLEIIGDCLIPIAPKREQDYIVKKITNLIFYII